MSAGVGGWKLKLATGYSLQARSGEFVISSESPHFPTGIPLPISLNYAPTAGSCCTE